MARKYVKPVIAFEPLSLSKDASGACDVQLTFPEYSCPVEIEDWGETVFTKATSCTWYNASGMICYHVPDASFNVFSS